MSRLIILGLTTILLLVLTACNAVGTNETEEETLTPITVQLKWFHDPEYMGFYVAERNGYYQEVGLDVEFIPGGPGVDVFTPLKDDTAQIGAADAELLMAEINRGEPFVAVGSAYQISPYVFVALSSEDGNDLIQSAEDWQGLRVMAGEDDLALYGILQSFGSSVDDIIFVEEEFVLGPLVDGDVDVMGVYRTDRGQRLLNLGYSVQFLQPEDYGVLYYEELLFTTTEFAENNTDTMSAFMRATMRGWEYALENRDDAIASIIAFDTSLDSETVASIWDATVPLIDDGEGLLLMDEPVFSDMQTLMLEQGIIEEPIDISTYFTNEFVVGDE